MKQVVPEGMGMFCYNCGEPFGVVTKKLSLGDMNWGAYIQPQTHVGMQSCPRCGSDEYYNTWPTKENTQVIADKLTTKPKRRRVMIESPLSAPTPEQATLHKDYLAAAIMDSLSIGEAPFAMHGFYPIFLDDANPEQRALGMECGFRWMADCDLVAFYYDLGISSGMRDALIFCARHALRIEFRSLSKWSNK